MDHITFFKDLFESILGYRKLLLLMFLIENDADSLTKYGYTKNDIISFYKEFKNILLEQNEDHLHYILKRIKVLNM